MAISPDVSLEDLADLISGPAPVPLPKGWWDRPAVFDAYRNLAAAFLPTIPPYPDRFVGRGIVICAGGKGLFTCAYVCVRMLRHLGCMLPIQLWHLDSEIDDTMREVVAPLGVACINAAEVDRCNQRQCRILRGFEVKPFAILHCPYREVLLIDADNVPVVDPSFLLETPEYGERGAVFWPDYGRLGEDREIWRICGISYRDEPEFETGQCLVDKARCWEALNLTMHYNEHSDFYYHHIHGDKDTFHMAFHRTGTPYAMPKRSIYPLDATMCQHDFQGRRIFQHRNFDKWSLDGSNRAVEGFWFEDVCRYFLAELRARWSGRLFDKPPADGEEARAFEDLAGKLFWYVRVGYDERVLEFQRDGTIGRGAARCERYWAVSRVDGRVMLTILGEGSPTCTLAAEDGVWRGRWLDHEKMPVELVRFEVMP